MINKSTIINSIIQSLPSNTVKQIFIFGSYANGANNDYSDMDLIIVSNCFEHINGYLRKKLFSSVLDNFQIKLDIVCLSEAEFEAFKNSDAYKKEYMELIYTGVI